MQMRQHPALFKPQPIAYAAPQNRAIQSIG
jgi:hypothetical protein